MPAADIRLDVGFPTHRKTLRLVRSCGGDGVFCLIRLWTIAALQHPDGQLRGWTPEDVELSAGWTGQDGALVAQLTSPGCNFLDRIPGGGFSLHDWADHQPWVVEAGARSARAKTAALARWGGRNKEPELPLDEGPEQSSADAGRIPPASAPDAGRIPSGSVTDANRNAPYRTVPSLTKPRESVCVSTDSLQAPGNGHTHTHEAPVGALPEEVPPEVRAGVEAVVGDLFNGLYRLHGDNSRFAKRSESGEMAGEFLQWRRDLEALFLEDSITPAKAALVSKWLAYGSGAQAGFWRPKITSGGLFRSKFDNLAAALREDQEAKAGHKPGRQR